MESLTDAENKMLTVVSEYEERLQEANEEVEHKLQYGRQKIQELMGIISQLELG